MVEGDVRPRDGGVRGDDLDHVDAEVALALVAGPVPRMDRHPGLAPAHERVVDEARVRVKLHRRAAVLELDHEGLDAFLVIVGLAHIEGVAFAVVYDHVRPRDVLGDDDDRLAFVRRRGPSGHDEDHEAR